MNCPPGTAYLVAVSGGADSMAMLAALDAIRHTQPEAAFSLRCIHVEHGIRAVEESRGDAELVRSFCEKLNIPCRIISIPPGKIAAHAKRSGLGIEATARQYRHRAWFREARRIEASGGGPVRIVTAHTQGDMLETVLMRIIRGAGPAGLAAMPASRGRLLRPLLALSRRDVLEYLAESNIPWREDSTNTDIQFFRNRIRHCLIPLMNELFPRWKGGLAALAETQSLTAAFIRDEAARHIQWQISIPHSLYTDAETFFAQPAIIREEALFQAIDRLLSKISRSGKNPLSVRRSTLRRFCNGASIAADLGPLRVRQDSGRIILSPMKSQAEEYGFSLLIKEPGLYTLKRVTIEVRPCYQSGAEDEAVESFSALLPMVLRRSFKDDRITAYGREVVPSKLEQGGQRIMSALDRKGIAAFIGSGGFFLGRDDEAAEQETDGKIRCIVRSNNVRQPK